MTSILRPDDPGYSDESSSFYIGDLRERIMNLENMIQRINNSIASHRRELVRENQRLQGLNNSITYHRRELVMENERLRILRNTLEDTNSQLNNALNSDDSNSLNRQRYRRNDRRNAHTPGYVDGDISPSRIRRQTNSPPGLRRHTNQIQGSPSDNNDFDDNSVNRRLDFNDSARNTVQRRLRF